MKIREVIDALERFAPLPLQESYDNAGLQIGLTDAEASGALLCLDVTEKVIQEAVSKGCNLVVAHHPLLFRPLKHLTDATQVERCVRMAVRHDICIYAAHTNLDNVQGGVNAKMAQKLGLKDVTLLQPHQWQGNGRTYNCGSGVMGVLPQPLSAIQFLQQVKSVFKVDALLHNELLERPVEKVALCGGAGEFMLNEAIAQGADAFLTGEMGYHLFFGHEQEIQMAALGHYQSEQFTKEIFYSLLRENCATLKVEMTELDTNPIHYL